MNHRNPPPPIPASSPTSRHSGSGSYFTRRLSSSNHDNSSSFLDTGELNGYSRTDDHQSMLYYKDKRVQHKSLLAAIIHKLKRNPWRVAGAAAFILSLVWNYRASRQTTRLLKAMNVKSVDQAITQWKQKGGASKHASSPTASTSKELRDLYAAQDKWVKRDTAWRHHVEKLQNHTQRESRRAVLDKFGEGPFHVQVKIVLPAHVKPDGSNYTDEDYDTFELELAPLSETPHSVHLFLEQVSHNLWNDKQNISFHINTAHILMGGPTTTAARQVFVDYGLAQLAFPEYSNTFPHEQFTLGFAGRPGGPSFYINSSNNTKVHGPGGQVQHALTEFADSCFAKVVSGFNVLEEIMEETDATHKTLIIGMRIIEWDEQYTLKDDERWRKVAADLNVKEDDYMDDYYYDSADEAGIADDDKHDVSAKKKMDATDADKEHVVHHHHHSAQYVEDTEVLAESPPKPVEPSREMQRQLDRIKREMAEPHAAQ